MTQSTLSPKKRIAIISPDFPPTGSGGIVTAHFGIFKSFAHAGYETKVFTYFNDMKRVPKMKEPHVVRSGPPKTFRRLIKAFSYAYFKFLERADRAYQTADIFQSAWGAASLNTPIKEYDPDILIIPDQGCPGLMLERPSKKCVTVLISHHNPSRFLNNPSFGVHSARDADMAVKIENRVLRKLVDRVICPSAHMAKEFQKTYDFSGPVAVIPNIVDHHELDAIAPSDVHKIMGLNPESPVIFIPSAANPLKGADYIREIIRRIGLGYPHEVGFFLSGDMPKLFAQRLSKLPPNVKVHSPGHMSYHENVSVMKSCSFGISPTLIESFGMALLEGAFCSLPMVSFEIDSVPELLINEETGMIARAKNIQDVIKSSLRLLENREMLLSLKEKSRKSALERYSADVTFPKFLEFVEQA